MDAVEWDAAMGRLATLAILGEVADERRAQDDRFGEQNHLNDTGHSFAGNWSYDADVQRDRTDKLTAAGMVGWSDILAEEVAEAFAESDPVRLREELIQVAAVAVNWVGSIDRRGV